jgi:hypothetical protein
MGFEVALTPSHLTWLVYKSLRLKDHISLFIKLAKDCYGCHVSGHWIHQVVEIVHFGTLLDPAPVHRSNWFHNIL